MVINGERRRWGSGIRCRGSGCKLDFSEYSEFCPLAWESCTTFLQFLKNTITSKIKTPKNLKQNEAN